MSSLTSPHLPTARASWARISLAVLVGVPAVTCRVGGFAPSPLVSAIIYGAAIVGASLLLAWAAEAAEHDMSGGLAIALLAFVAVLPEYAVDAYFAYRGGHDPTYRSYAAANMTGSNRLLLGIGWPLVVLIALSRWRRAKPGEVRPRALPLEPSARVELGALLLASLVIVIAPLTGQIYLVLGLLLFVLYALYLRRLGSADIVEPELIGTPALIGGLPTRQRRSAVGTMFLVAAGLVLTAAAPFANALVATGESLGIDRFLLVQWVAPLASEAPEFIVAVLFALRGSSSKAMGTLLSSKVNQWMLLVGGLPLMYAIGGGGLIGLPLDARQSAEVTLTLAQTALGVMLLLPLRIPRWAAALLLCLFLSQFLITAGSARYELSVVYVALALVAAYVNRRYLPATLAALGTGRRSRP
ncbi:MAG: sodium:proton exchanger [Actinomycetes bacterium]